MNVFRWLALAILLASLAISGFHRRRARSRGDVIPRSRESRTLIAGRLLVGLPLFGAVVAFIINPAWMTWSAFPAPEWTRWLGAGLGLAVIPSIHWVLRTLGRNVSETVLTKQDHALVAGNPVGRGALDVGASCRMCILRLTPGVYSAG